LNARRDIRRNDNGAHPNADIAMVPAILSRQKVDLTLLTVTPSAYLRAFVGNQEPDPELGLEKCR
jgi:hypothetical protein